MQSGGYKSVDVTPWETASGGKAVECHDPKGCTLTTTIEKPAGTYDVAVQYFDIWRGVSNYTLSVNGAVVATWKADDRLPPAQPDPHLDGQTSTRFTAHHVALKPGDVLELKGVPDLRLQLFHGAQAAGFIGRGQGLQMQPNLQEYAPVDYIELGPDGPITPQ
jgi:alpha-glucuronidase